MFLTRFTTLIFLLSGAFFLNCLSLSAQLKLIEAPPAQIDTEIEQVHSPNIALYDPAVYQKDKLILMIQGTGGSATDMLAMDRVFASWGYHVVSIDYKNNVISTICAHSKDSSCSYRFRKEIITGEPLSEKTQVDSVNSILNRFTAFLQYLARHDKSGGWNKFLESGRPAWHRIIVGGHSQGSGHAAMLGKMFPLSRVLIFSGPQDYLEDLQEPSPWLSRKSATPENRYYAFLHLKDPFNVHYQIANCTRLIQGVPADTATVYPGKPVQGDAHILVTGMKTKNPHGSTLSPVFKEVWQYMLGIQGGYLRAKGKQIVNDKEVLLRGIGLGGWMLQEPYMLRLSKAARNQHDIRSNIQALVGADKTKRFYAAWLKNGMQKSDVDSLKAWGFNSVRLPMHYNLFTLPVEEEPVRGENTWLKKGFLLTDSLLKWCTNDSIYLVLDLHAAPGGQGHDLPIADRDPTKPSLWQSAANRQKTIALWKKLAYRYKNEKWIGGYDLLNETNWSFVHPDDKDDHGTRDTSNAPLRKLLVNITKAIRAVDTNHIIFIEGNGWANNYDGILPPWDDNLVVSFHKYWNKNTVASIQPYLDIRKAYNVPLWLGEAGENDNEWYSDAVNLMEDYHIGWSWWPLKKIGTNNPFEVRMPEGYKAIIQYWENKGPKPSEKEAFKALMQLAENYKTKNLIVHYDVLNALFQKK